MRTIVALAALFLTVVSCNPQQNNYYSPAHESEPLLRVPSGEPESLDPRLVRSINGFNAVIPIYDGLLRHDYRGELVPAIAKSYDVSPDLKTYTFHLREAFWSNGDPVTSKDFKESWLSQLSPDFPAPNAYQLFLIKGARAFKEGEAPADAVGLKTPDAETLVVELNHPAPYFPELVATGIYFPVHESTRDGTGDAEQPVGNGPFSVKEWRHQSGIRYVRNESYWDRAEVKLEEVEQVFIDDTTGLNMFLAGELHWAGSPNCNLPTDALPTLAKQGLLRSKPAAVTTFFRVNVTRGPLKNAKFRKALSQALDRDAIAKHLMQGKQEPAYGLVPPIWRGEEHPKEETQAFILYQEALKELDTDIDSIPVLTLCYANGSERNQKIAQAVQQQWQKNLGITVQLQQCENVSYYDKLHQKDYDISLGSWLADYRDPINFLEVFKTKETPTNNTGWENQRYIELLDLSAEEPDQERRLELLAQAEDLMLDEAPVIPLFHNNFLFARKNGVNGINVSELGHFDFKYAFIDDPDIDELLP